MVWDFAEVNPFASGAGDISVSCRRVLAEVYSEHFRPKRKAEARQQDATKSDISRGALVSTDPPYYDNIGYADLV